MTPHCEYCADEWRAVLIGLLRQGIRPSVVARHYGLARSTVASVGQDARRCGCLPAPTCLYCPAKVRNMGGVCKAEECRRTYYRLMRRQQRARHGWKIGWRVADRRYKEPVGFAWPVLPRQWQGRGKRGAAVIVPALPIRYPHLLNGQGNRLQGAKPRNPLAAPPLAPTLGSAWDARWMKRAA